MSVLLINVKLGPFEEIIWAIAVSEHVPEVTVTV
jgi:hypothetical protein